MTTERPTIAVVSDATGTTAESVLTSVLVQFPGARFNLKRHPFVKAPEQVEDIFRVKPEGQGIVLYTLVSMDLREQLSRRGEEEGWTVVDVMGPLIQTFSDALGMDAKMVPGIFRHDEDDAVLLRRAISYTLAHDDGKGLDTLDRADLLILGASRTGKTPASIYLSCRRLKVANYPIVMGIPLPEEILTARIKTVGFRMSPKRLVELRTARLMRLHKAKIQDYASAEHVLNELRYSEKMCRQIPGCKMIDVTMRSVEETSEWITRNVL